MNGRGKCHTERIVVISDLHISACALDDFDCELEGHFVRFLDELRQTGQRTELVINGDFLDFVQAPPAWGDDLRSETTCGIRLCFTENQSLEKLEAIYQAHKPVFVALSAFLCDSGGNRLVILPGNHDIDLYFPSVRQRLQDLINAKQASNSGQMWIHLDRVYRPDACPSVWIEHGHHYDPVNSFTITGTSYNSSGNPPILPDKYGRPRLIECIGTGLLIRFLNDLDRDYPFIDNVKPFSRFLRIFALSAVHSCFGPLRAAIACWGLLKYLGQTGLSRPGELLSMDETDEADLHATKTLGKRIEDIAMRDPDWVTRVRQAGLDTYDFEAELESDPDRVLAFLAEHQELLLDTEALDRGYLSAAGSAGYLSLGKAFGVNETAELMRAAIGIYAASEPSVIVMGHTHEPVRTGNRYFNTGSWTRYLRFGADDAPRSWSVLRDGAGDEFPFELKFMDIDPLRPEGAVLRTFAGTTHA